MTILFLFANRQIRHQATREVWAVSLVITNSHLIFLWVLYGYVWVKVLTLSPIYSTAHTFTCKQDFILPIVLGHKFNILMTEPLYYTYITGSLQQYTFC